RGDLREPVDQPDPAAAVAGPGGTIRAASGDRAVSAPPTARPDPRVDVAGWQAARWPRGLRQRDRGVLRIPAASAAAPVRVVLPGGPADRPGRPRPGGRPRCPGRPRRAAGLPPGPAR